MPDKFIQYTAVIPAGGTFSARDLASLPSGASATVSLKALARVGDLTLLDIILTALSKVEEVSKSVVIGPPILSTIAKNYDVSWINDTGSLFSNIRAGTVAAGISGDDRVLSISADLAAPKPESIKSFLARIPNEACIALPLVEQGDFMRAYPGSSSSFVNLRDGAFTIGSLITAPAKLILDAPTVVAAFLGNRKSQIQMAACLGPAVALGLLTRSLTIDTLESRIAELTGVGAHAVPGCGPDLALDVDGARDLIYARSLIGKG
jgi:hypothetical protein